MKVMDESTDRKAKEALYMILDSLGLSNLTEFEEHWNKCAVKKGGIREGQEFPRACKCDRKEKCAEVIDIVKERFTQ